MYIWPAVQSESEMTRFTRDLFKLWRSEQIDEILEVFFRFYFIIFMSIFIEIMNKIHNFRYMLKYHRLQSPTLMQSPNFQATSKLIVCIALFILILTNRWIQNMISKYMNK